MTTGEGTKMGGTFLGLRPASCSTIFVFCGRSGMQVVWLFTAPPAGDKKLKNNKKRMLHQKATISLSFKYPIEAKNIDLCIPLTCCYLIALRLGGGGPLRHCRDGATVTDSTHIYTCGTWCNQPCCWSDPDGFTEWNITFYLVYMCVL